MSTPAASETFGQARQGSVAAIIQILNERLADSGIRTRAVVAEGMLQILCEAPSTEQLDKTTVVDRVRQILESISPQRIKRVNINSRIVKEEQLLWLEEISRDPENSLLWSQVITLKRPFFIKRWIRDRNLKPAGPILKDISAPDPNQGNLSGKVIGGAGLALLILGTGWIFREDIGQYQRSDSGGSTATTPDDTASVDGLPPLPSLPDLSDLGNTDTELTDTELTDTELEDIDAPEVDNPGNRTANTTPPPNTLAGQPTPSTVEQSADTTATTEATEPSPTDPTPTSNTPPPDSSGQTADAFAEAVRIANQAVADGQSATTAAEWLDLATRWQRASDLMAQIPEGSEQYELANERVTGYAENSQAAIQQAASLQE